MSSPKTHFLCALPGQLIDQGRSLLFTSCILLAAKRDLRLQKAIKQLLRFGGLISAMVYHPDAMAVGRVDIRRRPWHTWLLGIDDEWFRIDLLLLVYQKSPESPISRLFSERVFGS